MPADPFLTLLADPPDLPVRGCLPELAEAVLARRVAVLRAPPGTGKTTLVPPALAASLRGRVIVTQPRRIAVRAAARRLAQLIGEPVGRTVGYTVRGEHAVSAATRVEVVTTGVLLRRIQRDPELPGVGAVVLDELHERHLDSDLLLALLVDVRAVLRDDLVVVAMSATVETERTAALLGAGNPAPVVTAEGSLFPVAEHWCPPPHRVSRLDDRGVTRPFLDHVAACVRRALDENAGDVLVFVPGAREIDEVARRLAGVGATIRPLHGRLSSREQDAALAPGTGRRVVVSTAVTESSLTVPGIRVVVDAGLARRPRTDHRRGLAGLVTVRVSRSAAEQRAGRAGREGPGAVYRCWSPAEHAQLQEHPEPEILIADLTSFALEAACWGNPLAVGLALLDAPPEAAMSAARDTLEGLGATGHDGAVTPRGRAIADLGTDPRLGRALLDGADVVGSRRAAEVVAMLTEDVRAPGGDLVAALRGLRRGTPAAASWSAQVRRLEGALGGTPHGHDGSRTARGDAAGDLTDDLAVGFVVALAHPDRIARLRASGAAYLMTAGTGATLSGDSAALTGLVWIAVADADRGAGRRDALVRSAAPLDEELAVRAARSWWRQDDEVSWEAGRVLARRVTRLGSIELSSVPLAQPPAGLVVAAVRDGLAREGLSLLRWTSGAAALRARLDFLHRTLGEPWPDVSDESLLADLDRWLGPTVTTARGARDLERIDVHAALRRLLPWPEAGRLEELAPERVELPSGASVRVDYGADQPVVAVKIQEVFGWSSAPRLAGGRVPLLLHLLSPARRPAAVTADLESFWRTGYPMVRSELRGRYPKHAWPEDPWTVAPSVPRGAPRGGGARR